LGSGSRYSAELVFIIGPIYNIPLKLLCHDTAELIKDSKLLFYCTSKENKVLSISMAPMPIAFIAKA